MDEFKPGMEVVYEGDMYKIVDTYSLDPNSPPISVDLKDASGKVIRMVSCDHILVVETRSIREQILDLAKKAILTDRNADYGDPEDNFQVIANYWNNYLFSLNGKALEPYDIAAMMILMKISRLVTSPSVIDHWTDIAGYGGCGGECAAK